MTIFTPFIVAAISPAPGQEAQGHQYWTEYGFPLVKYSGAYLLGLFTFYLTVWRERSNRVQAGRDRFHEVTADMRAKRDEWKKDQGTFIEESVPILRQAVYRVQRFAKDWDGLHRLWLEYEARDKKDGKLTAFSCFVDDSEAYHGAGKSAFQIHSDYLDKFDAYVA